MLVDDPKDYEELHEMALDQELCIHITEDMLTMSPDQSNGYSGTDAVSLISIYCLKFGNVAEQKCCFILLVKNVVYRVKSQNHGAQTYHQS